MNTYYLPDDLLDDSAAKADEVVIRYYSSDRDSVKNRIVLNQNMINLLVSGRKTIIYPDAMSNGADGMIHFFNEILRPAIPDVHVTIHQQIVEGDLVTTRKTIGGTHTGTLLGIPATGRAVNIDVIDIVRVKDGKYFERWGITSLSEVLEQLQS